MAQLYILHSPALAIRDANVKKLQDLLPPAEVISLYDPGEITGDMVKTLVDVNATDDSMPDMFKGLLRPMHVNQLSNTLKHLAALRAVSALPEGKKGLIVEDDVLFNNDVPSVLDKVISQMPSDADIVFLGLPTTKTGSPDKMIFEEVQSIFKLLPCCDSYLVTPRAASILAGCFLPIRFPSQVQLSYLMDKLKLKAYVCSPNLFIDGTKLGVFISSIEHNNMLIWNPQYNQIRSLVVKSSSTVTPEDLVKARELLASAHFKDHPDMRYLSALAYQHARQYVKAKEEFDAAFNTYTSERAVLGPDCQFMKDYVQIFCHFQPK